MWRGVAAAASGRCQTGSAARPGLRQILLLARLRNSRRSLAKRGRGSGAYRLDGAARQLGANLSTKNSEQNQHTLARPHTGVESEVTGERSVHDTHLLACFEPLAPG